MPEHIDPRGQDNPSQYMVEDRSNDAKMIRLMIQDNLVTVGMGGPLSEQANPTTISLGATPNPSSRSKSQSHP